PRTSSRCRSRRPWGWRGPGVSRANRIGDGRAEGERRHADRGVEGGGILAPHASESVDRCPLRRSAVASSPLHRRRRFSSSGRLRVTAESAGPSFDDAKAQTLVGKYVLIGLTYLDHDGALISRDQIHGVVVSVDQRDGVTIELRGGRQGERFTLPPA